MVIDLPVMTKIKLNTIDEAIEEIKNGKVIIVVDDEDRENEGDFICAAETITPAIVNFMATHGRGLICVPLIEDRCEELGLEMMVGKNTASILPRVLPLGEKYDQAVQALPALFPDRLRHGWF